MQGAAIAVVENGRDPALTREDIAQRVPALADAVSGERVADELDELVGEHGDEQMPLGAPFLVVADRAQAELRFEAAEDRLEVGEYDVGAPHRRLVTVGLVAAQAIDARVGHERAFDGQALPVDRAGARAALIEEDLNVVVLTDAVAFLLEPPDTLPELVDAW